MYVFFPQGKNENQRRVAARARSPLFSPFFRQLFQKKKKRKRKAKRQITSGAQTSVFPLFFPLFFIFLKSKRKSKEQCKSPFLFLHLFSFSFRVPGLFVCVSGDFVPSSARKGARGLSSKKKGKQKADNVRGSLRLQLVCGKNIHVLSSEKKEDQKADNIQGHRHLLFAVFSSSFSFSFSSRPWGLRPASCVEAWFSFRRERDRAKSR